MEENKKETKTTVDPVNKNTGRPSVKATDKASPKSPEDFIRQIKEVLGSSRNKKEMQEAIAQVIEQSGLSPKEIDYIMNLPINEELKERMGCALVGEEYKKEAKSNNKPQATCGGGYGVNFGLGEKVDNAKKSIRDFSQKCSKANDEYKVKRSHKPAFDDIESNISKLNKVVNKYGIGDRKDIQTRLKDKKKINKLISKIDERFDEAKNATRENKSKGLLTSRKEKDTLKEMYKNAKERMKDSTDKLSEKAKKFAELKAEEKRMKDMMKAIMEFIENMFKGVINVLTFGRAKIKLRAHQPSAA